MKKIWEKNEKHEKKETKMKQIWDSLKAFSYVVRWVIADKGWGKTDHYSNNYQRQQVTPDLHVDQNEMQTNHVDVDKPWLIPHMHNDILHILFYFHFFLYPLKGFLSIFIWEKEIYPLIRSVHAANTCRSEGA